MGGKKKKPLKISFYTRACDGDGYGFFVFLVTSECTLQHCSNTPKKNYEYEYPTWLSIIALPVDSFLTIHSCHVVQYLCHTRSLKKKYCRCSLHFSPSVYTISGPHISLRKKQNITRTPPPGEAQSLLVIGGEERTHAMRKGRSGSPKVGESATRGREGVIPQSASPKEALARRGNKTQQKQLSLSPSGSSAGAGGSVNKTAALRTPVSRANAQSTDGDGDGSSPGTPASRRKGSDTPRTPLTTLASSPNVAPSSEAPLHSPFFGAQGSPGWMLHDGTLGLSDSVVSEQANYLVRETTTKRRRIFKVDGVTTLFPRVTTRVSPPI